MDQPNAPLPSMPRPRRARWWDRLGGGALSFAVLFHVALLIVGAIWVFQVIHLKEKDIDFIPHGGGGGSERGATNHSQHKRVAQMIPVNHARRVIAEGATTNIVLPDPGDSFGEFSALPSLGGGGLAGGMGGSGTGQGFGPGSGNGVGNTLGGAGNGKLFGPLSLFGQEGAGGIEGMFIDFKMDRNQRLTGEDPGFPNYLKLLQGFRRGGWDAGPKRFYVSPTRLNTPFFFFPAIQDRLAGPSFKSPQSGPGLWAAYYSGRCHAQRPGKYRLIGWGDNIFAVKINGKIVLDASDVQSREDKGAFVSSRERVGSVDFPGKSGTTVYAGDWIQFPAGDVSIDVVLGDQGGIFCAGLFVQPHGEKLEFGDHGLPKLPLFLLGELTPEQRKLLSQIPEESLRGPIFPASNQPSL